MSERRGGRRVAAETATLSLAEAASQLGVDVATLVAAIEASGVEPVREGQEFRLEAAEVRKYERLVAEGRSQARERLSGLLDEVE